MIKSYKWMKNISMKSAWNYFEHEIVQTNSSHDCKQANLVPIDANFY